eukprot:PhF_6_TR25612/c0_g2_i1/m.35953
MHCFIWVTVIILSFSETSVASPDPNAGVIEGLIQMLLHVRTNPIHRDLELLRTHDPKAPALCSLIGVKCDNNMVVRTLEYKAIALGGAVDFSAIPSLITNVTFDGCGLMQSATMLSELPVSVLHISVRNNFFTGTLHTPKESRLVYIDVSNNDLHGIAWEKLPRDLHHLDVSWNAQIGPLPSHMGSLSNLHFLGAAGCGLRGELRLPSVWLTFFNVSHNNLESSAATFTFPESESLQILDLSDNKFTGSVDWVTVPTSLSQLFL